VVRLALLACLAALAGCFDYLTSSFKTNEFSGDPYPILIDDSSGAVLVGVREEGSNANRTAVLDVMSPFTLIDRGLDVPPSIDVETLTVMGARGPGDELTLPRAQLVDQRVLTQHPCSAEECSVGTALGTRPFDALIGLDSFGGDALRLRLASDQIFILPDIAGSEDRRARSCDAVLDSPFRGGGTLVIGGTEVGFTNWRIAIDTCIAPNPARLLAQSARGADALFVLSTAIGPSLMTRTAYERYRELDSTVLSIDMLPEHTVILPSGPVVGNLASLPSIALVSNSGSNPRAPCRQVWASHLLATRDCMLGDDCPCSGENYCGVPAIVELAPAGRIPIVVVPDTEATLQALRTELRPDRPEVDGILGTDAIQALELDIDYTHDRLLARCVDRERCGARMAMPDDDRGARSYVNGCLGDEPGPIVFQDN
jgi:hypothetical protein